MYPNTEYQYLDLLDRILRHGSERVERTGVGTRALFAESLRFDLRDSFPLLTTKKVFWKTAFKEMLWMLSGSSNIRPLLEQGVSIWSEWPHQRYVKTTGEDISVKAFEARVLADEAFANQWGDLGPVYGKQWRQWEAKDGRVIDQISEVMRRLKYNPTSRRILFDGWNVGELDQMALPPCHKHYQFFVQPETNVLCAAMVQRSADAFLGLPFNLANLALLTHMMADQLGYRAGEITWMGMDVHLYNNHIRQVREQLGRTPQPFPTLRITRRVPSLFDYTIDDFAIDNYNPHPPIKAPVAV